MNKKLLLLLVVIVAGVIFFLNRKKVARRVKMVVSKNQDIKDKIGKLLGGSQRGRI